MSSLIIGKSLSLALYVLLLLFYSVAPVEIELQIQERIKEVEESLKKIKEDVELAYNDKASRVKECQPSYHQCSENLPSDYQCQGGHGTLPILCGGCNQEEMQLSYTDTTFMYPEDVFDPNNITHKQKETLCVYKLVIKDKYKLNLY